MPNVQPSYPLYQAPFVEGMIPNQEPSDIVSRVVESAAGIGFGKVAVKGAGDNGIRVSQATTAFEGITVLDSTKVAGTPNLYPQYSIAGVMKKGVVVVTASVAVAKGDPVYFVPATGVLTNVSTSNTLIANAQWDTTTTTTNQLAVLRLG